MGHPGQLVPPRGRLSIRTLLGFSYRGRQHGSLHLLFLIFTLFSLITVSLQDETCTDSGDYCRVLRPDECYHNEEFCCKTCQAYATNTPSCKFGDRATVCTDEYCLFTWNLEMCCDTCRNNLTTTTRSTQEITTRRVTITVPVMETNATSTRALSTGVTKPCQDGIINSIPCEEYLQANGQRFCYRYEDVCCATCSKIRETKPPACPYGDQYTWCKKLSSDQCYANNATCCETCESMKTNISECQFGDSMPSYCSTRLRRDCYEEDVFCCATCQKFLQTQAPPKCRYGDHLEVKTCIGHKANGRCGERVIAEKCCQTCTDLDVSQDENDFLGSFL